MNRVVKISTLISLGTYLLPLAVLAILLALNTGRINDGLEFKDFKWMLVFWTACAGICTFGALLAVTARFTENPKSDLWLPFLATSIVVVVLLGTVEAAIRVIATDSLLGQQFGSVNLKPYDWELTKQNNKALVSNSQSADAYFVADPRLGWAIGASRTSADGMYASSIEGLRSRVAGEQLANHVADLRIALYGNSFVFSEEVSYGDSVAYHLEDILGSGQQILNFGVPGYGIDQAHLRFEYGSAEWRPDIAILGFIRHDLIRALDVYTFLRPSWGIPFSKPRYEITGNNNLQLNNVPNIPAAQIFAANDIAELPLIELDPNYFAFDWKRRFAHNSMIFRLLASLFPRYPTEDGSFQHTASEIGARITEKFTKHAQIEGITPLVVYLPSRSDFESTDMLLKEQTIDGALELGVEVVDLTECLGARVNYEDLFVPDGVHYSGKGNRAFAECLLELFPENLPVISAANQRTRDRLVEIHR